MLVEVGFGLVMLSVAVHGWLSWTTRAEVRHVAHAVATTVLRVEDAIESFEPADNADGIVTEVVATIEDIFSNMHVPTAGDQLVGGAMQVCQLWMQKKMMGDMDPNALAALIGGSSAPQEPHTADV